MRRREIGKERSYNSTEDIEKTMSGHNIAAILPSKEYPQK